MERWVVAFPALIGTIALFGLLITCACYSGGSERLNLEAKVLPPLSEEQSGRLRAVSKHCEKIEWYVKSQQWKDSVPHMIVDDERRVLFCAIPKVASSNWKRIFIKLLNVTVNGSSPIRDVHVPGLLPDLRQFSRSEQEYRLRNYFKFMFVRNPLERLLSAYRNKLENKDVALYRNPRRSESVIMKVVTGKSPDLRPGSRKITFSEFAETLTDPSYEIKHYNVHWKQYYKVCHPCFVNYDFIGKMESFATDLDYVKQASGMDYGPWFKHTERTTTPAVSERYYSTLSERSKRALSQMYSIDTGMFQYV